MGIAIFFYALYPVVYSPAEVSHIFDPFLNLWEDTVLMLCVSQPQTVIFKSFVREHLFLREGRPQYCVRFLQVATCRRNQFTMYAVHNKLVPSNFECCRSRIRGSHFNSIQGLG